MLRVTLPAEENKTSWLPVPLPHAKSPPVVPLPPSSFPPSRGTSPLPLCKPTGKSRRAKSIPSSKARPATENPPARHHLQTRLPRHQSTSAGGQPQPQKTTKFTISPQTTSPSRCPKWASDIALSSNPQENASLPIRSRSPKVLWTTTRQKQTSACRNTLLGIFLKHTLKCTIKPTEVAAHRDVMTELKARPTTGHDRSGCPLQTSREGGWNPQESSLHPTPAPCRAQRPRVEVAIRRKNTPSNLAAFLIQQFSSLFNTSPMGKAVNRGYPERELKGCADYKSKALTECVLTEY